MMFIYQLKSPRVLTEFVKQWDDGIESEHACRQYLVFICLVTDEALIKAEALLDRLADSDVLPRIPQQQLHEIYEFVAVLWAQRELTDSRLSVEQAYLLKDMFNILGGTSVFRGPTLSLPVGLS